MANSVLPPFLNVKGQIATAPFLLNAGTYTMSVWQATLTPKGTEQGVLEGADGIGRWFDVLFVGLGQSASTGALSAGTYRVSARNGHVNVSLV